MFAGIAILILFLFLALDVVGWILIAVGITNDAKGYYNPNSTMWGVLTFLVGLIPIIIYFCTRKNYYATICCPNCHGILPGPLERCPFCSNATGLPPEDPAYIVLRAKGKKQMISGLVLLIAATVLGVLVGIALVVAIGGFSTYGYGY